MSVLIQGMEMPTKENAVILITPSGDVWMIGAMPNEDTHLVKAKAIPVPPHGDLIERKELLKHDNQHYEYLSDEFYVTVRDIERIPTIIPADKEVEP